MPETKSLTESTTLTGKVRESLKVKVNINNRRLLLRGYYYKRVYITKEI